MRLNVLKKFESLSQREQYLVLGGFAVVIPLFLHALLIKPVIENFREQRVALEQLDSDFKTIPFVLDRYRKFARKKTDLEREFKQVEIKEGEQSLLENILSGKVDPGFDITAGQTRNFGGNYEQAAFTVRFSTSRLATVVELLTEITSGAKRMLLTSLSISRDPSGEKLRVEISVSSIRQVKASS
jgi:hypothetical protein